MKETEFLTGAAMFTLCSIIAALVAKFVVREGIAFVRFWVWTSLFFLLLTCVCMRLGIRSSWKGIRAPVLSYFSACLLLAIDCLIWAV